MPTTVTKTIKPGGVGNYISMAAAEAVEATNLVTADQIKVFECYDFGASGDTSNSAFNSGWTTDSTRYLEIKTPLSERHTNTTGTGYRLKNSGNSPMRPVTACSHLRITGIAFDISDSSLCIDSGNGATDVIIDSCFFTGNGGTYHVLLGTNWIIRNSASVGAGADSLRSLSSGVKFEYCTVIGSGNRGIVNAGSSNTVKNCISVNSTGVNFYDGSTCTYCLSSDTSLSAGSGNLNSRTVKYNADLPLGAGNYVIFQSSTNLNLVNDAENDALAAGNPIAGVTLDYAGDTRDATTPDMGNDELVVAATAPFLKPLRLLQAVNRAGTY